jgi:hypothetical protein
MVTGFVIGVLVLGFYLLAQANGLAQTINDMPARLEIQEAPPVIHNLVQPAPTRPATEAPKLPELGGAAGETVKREGWTEEIKDGLSSSGGRNK